MLDKKKNRLLILALLVFSATLIFDYFQQPSYDTERYVERVQTHLHEMEKEVGNLLANRAMVEALVFDDGGGGTAAEWVLTRPYTVALFRGDSLVFWNNVDVGYDINDVSTLDGRKMDGLEKLPNGLFYVKRDSLWNGIQSVSFFPIKYQSNIKSIYFSTVFAVDKQLGTSAVYAIPQEVDAVEENDGAVILDIGGEEAFHLALYKAVEDKSYAYILLLGYLLAIVLGGLWTYSLAEWVTEEYSPWWGFALFGGILLLLRVLMIQIGFSESFRSIPLFTQIDAANFFADSLGDMLINAALALWIAVFFHKEFKVPRAKDFNFTTRFVGTLISYSAIILGILIITYVLKGLVLGTDIPFDFQNIANLEMGSFLSIVGILFLMLMLFLFTHRISATINELNLTMYRRLLALGLAAITTFTIAWGLDLGLPLLLLLLFSVIYIVSFDLFVEQEEASFTWIVIWLVIFSGFSSAFLYKYNVIKEYNQRVEYAESLSQERTPEVEEGLRELFASISSDGELDDYLHRGNNFDYIEELLKRNHTIDLRFLNYKHGLHLFQEDTLGGMNLIGGNSEIWDAFQRLEGTLEENIRFMRKNNALGTYLLLVEFPQEDLRPKTAMVLEFSKTAGRDVKVYTELFVNEEYRKLEVLSEYEYAIYMNDSLVTQKGNGYTQTISREKGLPKLGEYRFDNTEERSHLVFHADNGTVVMLNRELPVFSSKFMSLFSYLFTIMVIVLSILSVLNAIVHALPSGPKVGTYSPTPSLRNKIQISVIAVIILSFLVIGLVTIFHFDQKNDEYHEKRLGRKAKAIRGSMAREVEMQGINSNSLFRLDDVANSLSAIHSTDINIYGMDGRLIASSMPDIFSKGLISPLMNASAYRAMHLKGNDVFKKGEKVGTLNYEVQYEPILDAEGKTIAYIGMTYYAQQSKLQSETSGFIGALLNVYVFLLLLAGAIAIAVANSITRPLSVMGEKLKQVKLGRRNEPLEWKSKDELGTLIGEYNRMIRKLEDSARLLAQSERESAWREMAKQVAHEIKNPLTPMKLSIQYLQYAYRSNPESIEPMLKRVSNTLIEQIDNLSHIATEFSNFAKMPRAENERFIINYLVQSVFDLFSEREGVDLRLSLPNGELSVFADKNQLMRVFNNLIQNAIQAIPVGRHGEIQVILRRLPDMEDDILQLEVKDNGEGINEDMREYVFVPNFTTKSSGTGLGLAISKSIVEALGGNIYFETVVNVGTSFFVELPIAKEGVLDGEQQ